MTQGEKDSPDNSTGKGKAFFDRGDQVAETGNWDFAIQMYLQGIRREPDNLQRGHQRLREVSLKRRAQGGKPTGFLESLKLRGGKEPVEALVNAEQLLARDPGNVNHMVSVLKAARKLQLPGVVKWICDMLFEAMSQAKRPSRNVLVLITEAYQQIEEFASAVQTCDMALSLNPNDAQLQDLARNLSARDTIKQGQYDGEGSFVKSVRDMDKQIELSQRDQMVQSREFMEKEIEKARAEYLADPTQAGKIDALVEALLKIPEEAHENEALEVLGKAHQQSGAYRFKFRLDDIRIRQMRRQYNQLASEAGKEKALTFYIKETLPFELNVFTERAKNYPTDLSIKYDLGRRQLQAGQLDEAISSLQQAQRDAKYRVPALCLLGQAFAAKKWHREAVETYEKALEFDPGDERSKEIHYNLGLCLKAMNEKAKALDHFSTVAQLDYNYRDARQQIDELRKAGG